MDNQGAETAELSTTELQPAEGEAIVGIYADDGTDAVYLRYRGREGRSRDLVTRFRPFLWATTVPAALERAHEFEFTTLDKPGTGSTETLAEEKGQAAKPTPTPFRYLLRFNSFKAFREVLRSKEDDFQADAIRSIESQFLLHHRLRMYEGLAFAGLRRCQLDIETACGREDGFSTATEKEDRILAIGLRLDEEERLLTIARNDDNAERQLLKAFGETLRELDPDVIEGHNLHKFDLDYLKMRCRRYRVKPEWGRFGGRAAGFRNSRLRVAERWIDFPRCDIPGRAIFDTYLAIQLWDVAVRDLPGYGLKEVALHLGVTPSDGGDRTYIEGWSIQRAFEEDRERFMNYLRDDLRETHGIAEILEPTYVAQIANFPTTLQDAALRGTGSKVDLLFLDKYYHAAAPLPEPPEARRFEGAFSKSFQTGVFHKVLHFDVASLYPSLLMTIGRGPGGDVLGVFGPLLEELRAYRLDYKRRAREATDPELKREYDARQQSFKILINSFYGYLGFPGARFGDSELAAEVTRRGRELLQSLIERFNELGATVLEADTDGIYLTAPDAETYANPESLLGKVSDTLPEGIALEYDGSFRAMFCYKAKNYALFDGERVKIRGSALRSRGTEPYLKELTDGLIYYLLGASQTHPLDLKAEFVERIKSGDIPVEQLAKAEYLSQNPEAYRKTIEKGGKPRRASLEVALRAEKDYRMGDQVRYFIGPKTEKGQTSDWQRAHPVEAHDPETCPYDPVYYLKKLKDWEKRYGTFLDAIDGDQGVASKDRAESGTSASDEAGGQASLGL